MNEKIISKIQKLMNLASNNSNDFEAADAMLKAQQLMAEHKISMSHLKTNEEKATAESGSVLDKKATAARNVRLAQIIAKNFKCVPMLSGNQLVFIGLAEDLEMATTMFKSLYTFIEKRRRQIYKEYQTAGKETAGVRDTYVMGFLAGLEAQFAEQIKTNSSYAMMVVTPTAVTEHVAKCSNGKRTAKSASTNYDSELRNRGYQDGKGYGKQLH